MDGGRLQERLDALRRELEMYSPGLIAVSGGLDSRLLFFLAGKWGLSFEAVHFAGPHLTPGESAEAQAWLERQGRPYHVVEVAPLELAPVRNTARDRCYHCKHHLFTRALALAEERGFVFVLDGSNASDHGKYRPGLKALAELGVKSPYVGAGMGKAEIKAAARSKGLDFPDQAARPCLLTRFAYGVEADADVMKRLGEAEDALTDAGLQEFRIRVPQAGRFLLQVAVQEREIFVENRERVEAVLHAQGLAPFELIFNDGVSGYYDRNKKEGRDW